jgi:hypothetical protein
MFKCLCTNKWMKQMNMIIGYLDTGGYGDGNKGY